MSRQHQHSCDCTKSELDLFSVPPTQTSIDSGYWTDTHPTASVTEDGPIEFDIPGEGEQYYDLSNLQLYVKAKIVKNDNTAIGADDHPGPVNNWLHSLFEQVELSLGDTIVSSATHTYPYRAYLETLASLGNEAKETQLTTALWYKDDPERMDGFSSEVADNVQNNKGLQERGKFTARSAVVEMVGRLHCDIFSQERLMINKVPIRIKLIRSKNTFCIMANANDFKVKIESAILFVRRVTLADSVYNAHQKALRLGPAKYPVKRVVCKYFQIPQGSTSTNQENLFQGQMPTRLIVGCVDSDAFNGTSRKNPFNFKHKNISEVALRVGGFKGTLKPLQPNFPNQSLLSYLNYLTGIGKWGKNEGSGFDRREHANGYTLFAWDLTPDLSDGGDHFQLKKDTSVRLEMKFREPLTTPTNCIVYAEFENMILVDNDRNVSTNFKI